jgi:RNA polymerase sigma factor (sigma-70 family)
VAGVQLGNVLRQIQRLYSGGSAAGLSDAALLDRFAGERDEDAFAALVARHGPMVLAVCRGVVRDPGDAEDAFQATFLILARRVGALRVGDSLGGWLHRVAYRVAIRANGDAMRRRSRERLGVEMDAIAGRDGATGDLRSSELHEAIARLPEALRRAVVLCDLEGRTQVEAARELGCGEATLRRRLAGAHERLKARLRRSGLAGAVGALVRTDPIPAGWIEVAARAASASGPSATSAAGRLAAGVLGAMTRAVSLRLAALLVVGAGLAMAWLDARGRGDGPTALGQAQLEVKRKAVGPAPKASGRITGRVVRGAEASAAEGAEVILLLPPPRGQDHYIGKYPLLRTAAGAKGTFSFDGLPPGSYRVWANLGRLTSRTGAGRGEGVILPESGAAPKPVELRLVDGVVVTVRAKDKATGRPSPNATGQLAWSDYPEDAVTDRDGLARIQPLTARQWPLEVRADGFAKVSRSVNLENGADADEEFLLASGGDLEGVVRDPSGKPLAGVKISAFAEGIREQFDYVETGIDGRYRLSHLPIGFEIALNMSRDDFLRREVTTHLAGGKQALDLTMQPRPHGGSIAGVVLDHQGRPIAGAELINMGMSSDLVRETKTGPDGRFRLDDLFEDTVGKEVLVRARGSAPRRVKVEPGAPDRPAEVAIRLEPGHRIKGRVADEEGRPLAGVHVYFAGANHGSSDGGQATTDDRGRFAFDSLPADCPFAFSRRGYSGIEDRQLPLDTDDVVPVVMVPVGVIDGKVLDARTGKPISAFNVQITFSPRRQPGEPSNGLIARLTDPGQMFRSDAGRFKLGDLVVGMPLQVMVSARGYERQVTERVVVARPDGGRVEEFRLAPVDPAERRTYRGRLVDGRGNPVAAAQLRLIAARGRDPDRRRDFPFNWTMIRCGQLAQQSEVTRFLEAATDAQGRFAFTGVPRGDEVELAWWGKGIAPGRSDHLERLDEKASIEVAVPAPARIIVTVDRKAFVGAGQIQVTGDFIEEVDGGLKPGQTEIVLDDLAPDEYRVNLMGPDERVPGRPDELAARTLGSMDVTVGPGETKRVEFRPAEITPRTKAILARLEEPIAMEFPREVPLDDVVQQINRATRKGPNEPGIPIYVDPPGLLKGWRVDATGTIHDKGLALKDALVRLLRPFGVAFIVKDDVLIISDRWSIQDERNAVAIQACDASPESRVLLARLEKPVIMEFPDDTPLGDVLAYLKAATEDPPGDRAMEVLVIPAGLAEAGKTLNSPIRMDLERVPLKTTLRLLFGQLGLACVVKDGRLVVHSPEGIAKLTRSAEANRKAGMASRPPTVKLP